mmetsp:Transcript_40259/g.96468  ORF Transcript_40259/g.96468 Transcript_40259/m.96468 type:complete len:199 (-) Transcript_40259:677-1273(-)
MLFQHKKPKTVWLHECGSFVQGMGQAGTRSVLRPQWTGFDSDPIPDISMPDYLMRLGEYCPFSEVSFVLALIYIDRRGKLTSCPMTTRSMHRLYMTCLLVAAKFWEDHGCPNGFYAQVAGVSLSELNSLEAELLRDLQWNLVVSEQQYNTYLQSVDFLRAGHLQPGVLKRSNSFGMSEISTEVGGDVSVCEEDDRMWP